MKIILPLRKSRRIVKYRPFRQALQWLYMVKKSKSPARIEKSRPSREKELSILLKVSSSLSATLDLKDVLQIAIESATDLLGLNTGAIYTDDGDTLYLGATTPPLPEKFPEELRVASLKEHPHINETLTTKSPLYLEDANSASLSEAEKIVVESRHLVSILYFPLLLKGTAIGVFIVGTTKDIRKFSKNEIKLCYALSNQVALAISNARLYQEAQKAASELIRAYDATLEGWSRVLDMRDHDTDEHTRRVSGMTIELARRMGIPDSELGHIYRGALLHDIGKMAIPDSILQKQGSLTEDEKKIMRTHPEIACKFLSNIEYLAPALIIPYCHHEKWDGTGYPRGLKEEDIPLSAQLFAVVDVYDALISDRPYRKAWTEESALNYIRDESGRSFSPGVVQAFLDMMSERKKD